MAKTSAKAAAQDHDKVYSLQVRIIEGLMSEEFVKRNPVVSRTIQIRGRQTLEQLHRAIFKAFGREDEHLYEFYFSDQPQSRDAIRYVLPFEMEENSFGTTPPAGDVKKTKIESLNLNPGDVFFYWFDFGDDWWHEIRVTAIEEGAANGRYPKVVKKIGESPPQYMDWDESEYEEENG